MGIDKRSLLLALAISLTWTGCGKLQNETEPVADKPATPATAESSGMAPGQADANEARSGTAELAGKSPTDRPTEAEERLKKRYENAVAALQAGDYSRAVSDLPLLTKTPGLTPDQTVALQELLAQILKAAREQAVASGAAAGSDATQGPPPRSTTEETLSGGAGFMRDSMASPFAQAGQALKEDYDSALIAFQIADYDRAVNELKLLVENPDLTIEQAQAARDLLNQSLQAAREQAPSPGVGTTNGAKP